MEKIKIGIIGLGYVGLPLARLFATKYPVVGFDVNQARVNELMSGHDSTLEVDDEVLKEVLIDKRAIEEGVPRKTGESTIEEGVPRFARNDENDGRIKGLYCTTNLEAIRDCNFYVVTVPTPVDVNHNPDLTPLKKASETVGKVISKGDIVVYESTVYPGVTEDECLPIVEAVSGLKFNKDFFAGYSPERINPGDKLHTVEKILKITSGSTPEIAQKIDAVYSSVIIAGTHLAPSIQVAEAAKVIENAQRDINIAFVNELAKIFGKLGIDTHDVLTAAGTKWNFLPFKPGLVGGHCIGIDPYYLAQAAQRNGYHPEIILAGRRINDSMGPYVAKQVVKLMLKTGIQVLGSNILVLGFTFKENCPDIRNTRVIDIINELIDYDADVCVYDPWVNQAEAQREYGLHIYNELPMKKYDTVILAVSHDKFKDLDIKPLMNKKNIVYDVKGFLEESDYRL